ncbi:hypothetical protein TNCV_2570741 [Trichonephila clavipes]|nr:hypothetical protein TNCV_2570741 [Trichonephila clavipes]
MTEMCNSFLAASRLWHTSSTVSARERVRVTIEYPVYRIKSEHNGQQVVMHYLVGRLRSACLEDWVQPLDVRCHKCAYRVSIGFPNYHTKCWASIPISNASLVVSGHVYGHQDTARRTGTHTQTTLDHSCIQFRAAVAQWSRYRIMAGMS